MLISNRHFFFDNIEDRLRSRLFLAEVEFPQYKKSELVDIIKERIDYALTLNSIANELIEIIATWANGDARVALQTVRAAAMSADSKQEIPKLNEHQRFLMNEIEKNREIDSGELFRMYQDLFNDPLGERAYRNQMEHLVQTGLVKETGEGRWKRFERSH
jgi:Cdc6-like AAA superfamily ATPase